MDESVMKSVQCHSAEEKDDQNEVGKSGGEIHNLKKTSYLLIYIDYRILYPIQFDDFNDQASPTPLANSYLVPFSNQRVNVLILLSRAISSPASVHICCHTSSTLFNIIFFKVILVKFYLHLYCGGEKARQI